MNERQRFAYENPIVLRSPTADELQPYRRVMSIGIVQDFGEVFISTILTCSRDANVFDGFPFWQASGAFLSEEGPIAIKHVSEYNQTALASSVVWMTRDVGQREAFNHVIVADTTLQYFKRFSPAEAMCLPERWQQVQWLFV